MNTTRKEILLRKQKGKAILSKWKMSIEAAINQSVSIDRLLDIETTELLRKDFFEKVRHCMSEHRFAREQDFGELLSELQSTLANQDGRQVVLFHSKDKLIGALQVDVNVVSSKLEDIWQVVEEDLCVATMDLTSGFCLESNYYGESGQYIPDGVFELTAWGDFAIT